MTPSTAPKRAKATANYDVDASVAALPEGWLQTLQRFRDEMDGNAAVSTRNDYHRHAKQFVAWCFAQRLDVRSMPVQTPEAYYTARGWNGANAYRNIVTSALRTFLRWSNALGQNGPGVRELEFPPSIRPPKKRAVTEPIEDEYYEQEALVSEQNGVRGEVVVGEVPSLDGVSETPLSALSVPGSSTPPSAPVAPPAAPPVAEPPPFTPGLQERPLARQRITDKRQTKARDPLGSLLPSGGFIELGRVSDGTDGASPGQRVVIGRYREQDVQGYNDFGPYVHDQVHPYADPPLRKTSVVTYVAQRFDQDEKKIGGPHEIRVPNTLNVSGGGASSPSWSQPSPSSPPMGSRGGFGGLHEPASSPNQQTGNPAVDAVLGTMLQQFNRFNDWQMEQNRRYEDMIERTKNGEGSSALMFALQNRPAPVDINQVVDSAFQKITTLLKDEKAAAAAVRSAMPIALPPPPPKDEVTGKLLDVVMADRARPQQDPIAMAKELVALGRPAQQLDPYVEMLKENNRRLEDQLRETIRELKDSAKASSNTPDAWFKQMAMYDEMMDRKLARSGGSGAGIFDAITTLADKLPGILREARLGQLAPPEARQRAQQPQPQPQGQPQQAQQEQPAQQQQAPPQPVGPTVDMNKAYGELASAFDAQSDQGVLTGVFSLINALAQGGPQWFETLKELHGLFQQVETLDELQFLVHRLFMTCGQSPLAKEKPGLIRYVADVLAINYPSVCTKLDMPVRELPGADLLMKTAQPVAPVAEPSVETKRGVVVDAVAEAASEAVSGEAAHEEEEEEVEEEEEDDIPTDAPKAAKAAR